MDFIYSGPVESGVTLLLAHGAGSGMESPWLVDFSDRLAQRGLRTARFEFAYMAARRSGGKSGQPRAEAVADEYRAAVSEVDTAGEAILIGGKSFGGRVASLIADELWNDKAVAGLVCLGYPFHPPGKPEQPRTAHLRLLECPTLICQGTRDPFGTQTDVAGYELSSSIEIHWLEDGEHNFQPRKAVSGLSFAENLDAAADAVARFASSFVE
jgi:predicted alpha/beta-hydrolase family hydrolase